MTIHDMLNTHRNIALQFSGGRDSLALLLAMRPYWDRLTVYYTDSGDAYPETQALVDAVRAVVPHFKVIEGRVKQVHEQAGWPSDVLQPGTHYPFARTDIDGHVPLIDRHNCCMHSIMLPMHEQMRADGITLILRGQRNEDSTKSHVQNGQVIEGIQIAFPIADWTTADVEKYIADCGIPMHRFYEEGLTSAPDCMRCTAWLEHGAVGYLNRHHPEVAREVNERLQRIRVVVEPHFKRLTDHLGG